MSEDQKTKCKCGKEGCDGTVCKCGEFCGCKKTPEPKKE